MNQQEILEGKKYTHSQLLRIKAAFEDLSTTRKTGRITKKKKIAILLRLAEFPPEIAEYACDWYVAHKCAAEGKDEGYLIAICRNEVKRREMRKQKRTETFKIDPVRHWFDGSRLWSRDDMEAQRADLVEAWENNRNTDPAKVSRVNRCMHERPQWDWV